MRKSKDFFLVIFAEILAVFFSGDCVEVRDKPSPQFVASMANVTVTEGETAVLIGKVKHMNPETEICWVKTSPYNVLAYSDHRVIDDTRITLEHPVMDEYNLHIRDAVFNDSGSYLCFLNANPPISKTVTLNVIVLPKILGDSVLDKVEVMENGTATLECRTEGSPQPRVEWRRMLQIAEDGEKSLSKLCSGTTKVGNDGEVLIIANITRRCGGTYQCVATNSRGDSASKDFQVDVLFAPEVTVPNPRIYHEIGKETVLDCYIMASEPIGEAVWLKEGTEVKSSSNRGRYRIDLYKESSYMQILSLRLLMIEESHFGTYTCMAKNQIGRDSANITLYDYSKHRKDYLGSTLSTTTEKTNSHPSYMYPSRRQQYLTETGYSREPHQDGQKDRIEDDKHLKYETGRPNYRNYMERHNSDKDGANHFIQNVPQIFLQMVSVWLLLLRLTA